MLSTHLNQLQRALTDLRYQPAARAFNFGYVTGLLSGYLAADLIGFDVYKRLTALKLNAWDHCPRCDQGEGA
ncbi:hypothetical protein D1O90_005021 [Escherichia coli]|nr:hypothetical protein [Escherichia coli]